MTAAVPDPLAAALQFTATRFVAIATELDAALVKLAAVEALIVQARKISPSPSMSIYVADLDRALGRDAVRPHKTGAAG